MTVKRQLMLIVRSSVIVKMDCLESASEQSRQIHISNIVYVMTAVIAKTHMWERHTIQHGSQIPDESKVLQTIVANTPSSAAMNALCTVSAGMISPFNCRSIVAHASATSFT